MMEQAVKNNLKLIMENKRKFICIHSSSGFKHSLTGNKVTYSGLMVKLFYSFAIVLDVLNDPSIVNRLNDTKALGEVKLLDAFYTMLKNEPSRAFYG